MMIFSVLIAALLSVSANVVSLNGEWECGLGREYTKTVPVPGLAYAADTIQNTPTWYRRRIQVPDGDWNKAELELKGARFRPSVYVDGRLVSRSEGGMSLTVHPLPGLAHGGEATIEIELQPLSLVPKEDASYIPGVDQWRSNVSSCLWDDVNLVLYRDARVDRVLTFCDASEHSATLRYRVRGTGADKAVVRIYDGDRLKWKASGSARRGENELGLKYRGILREWSPSSPACYRVDVELYDAAGESLSRHSQTLCLRTFKAEGTQFFLNGKPIRALGGSVVWHRWVRDREASEIAFDAEWFRDNVVAPMKERGANYIRFHLGVPPERYLDVCDSCGLMVQYEWSFFHGMPASRRSLDEQYARWLDVASRHPSVVLFHPYNETEPAELQRVTSSLDSLLAAYPSIALEDRDVLHTHRYWWGMSENIGLYYDSPSQFVKPVMVDEFGGIYLDGNYDIGGYPMLAPAMKRWLGYDHDAADRRHQQELAYGKVGEYWRRLGVAGVAAFPILCSWQDGNNWYEGPVREGRLKSVWDKMTVVWAARTVSMDIWNRNCVSGQKFDVPVHLMNDSDAASVFKVRVSMAEAGGGNVVVSDFSALVPAHGRKVVPVSVTAPDAAGRFILSAILMNPSAEIKRPVVSEWEMNVVNVDVPETVKNCSVFIPDEETELRSMASTLGLKVVAGPDEASALLFGRCSWENIGRWIPVMDRAVGRGASAIMLDVGDNNLGKSYDDEQRGLGNVSGSPKINSASIVTTPLFAGLSLTTVQLAEGESHIHPSRADSSLWRALPMECTRLWNGLRGGIIVPAASMEASGLSQNAFLSQWTARGADSLNIVRGPYFAYEYCGFYAYDNCEGSEAAVKFLKDKVEFLVEDMPALALSLPRNVPVRTVDLHSGYAACEGVRVSSLVPLVVAGKDLVRTPVVKISFGDGEGSLIVSQLLTSGRLAPGYAPGRRVRPLEFDSAAVQMVVNMIDSVAR